GVALGNHQGDQPMPVLKLTLLCASALLLVGATQPSTHTMITPGKVAVEWYFSDTTGTWDKDVKPETRVWLEVRSANSRDWAQEGYNPSFTYVTVKDCVPVVRKLGDGRYEIAFRSEIAKDLP